MVKILAIGNSFSQDAAAYLHALALRGGIDTKVVNLFIPGCSLAMHWENLRSGACAYQFELNGTAAGRMVSLEEALLEDGWDAVTLQQASYDSGLPESYYPYVTELAGFIKDRLPGARRLLHQTWAYEIDSTHEAFERYGRCQDRMYNALKNAYQEVSDTLKLDLIPCGSVIQALRGRTPFDVQRGGLSLCRDGFHLSLGYGRYTAAAVWYMTILRKSILDNDYIPPAHEGCDPMLIQLIRQTVHEQCGQKQ